MSEHLHLGGDSCQLCGEEEAVLLAKANAHRHRTVVCPRCRLIYASPAPSPDDLERHYELEFRGDAGGEARIEDGALDDRYVGIEEARVRSWVFPLVCELVPLQGARVLDLRCQSGALAAALVEAGATVTPVDPFQANVRYVAEVRGLSQAVRLPMSQFHDLPGEASTFDAVTALNEHVPGHVLQCKRFLTRVWQLLKPGGYLLLDEKHVLRPIRFKVPSLLDTGHAHVFHFVPQSLRAMLESCGYEVIRCDLDQRRRSSFRHLSAVARRPTSGEPAMVVPRFREKPSIAEIRRALWWSHQRYRLTQARYAVKRGFGRRAA